MVDVGRPSKTQITAAFDVLKASLDRWAQADEEFRIALTARERT